MEKTETVSGNRARSSDGVERVKSYAGKLTGRKNEENQILANALPSERLDQAKRAEVLRSNSLHSNKRKLFSS